MLPVTDPSVVGDHSQVSTDVFTVAQMKMAKAALGLSNTDLAERIGMHKNTVNAAENGHATQSTLLALQQVLETAGIVFLQPEGGLGEGIRLRESGKVIAPLSRLRPKDQP